MVDVEEIKKRLDIVEVISDYLTLKKSGITYKALCPFHSEKTPSFTVSAERQSWHCFGCNEGGDVISFVQKIDGLDFGEAIERLAAKAGVEIRQISDKERQTSSDKTHILTVMETAANLYHELLLHHPKAGSARAYIEQRGISPEMVKQFRLGYAPAAWHTIEAMLDKKKLEQKWGYLSGLAIKKTGSEQMYDRFRDRLMFPIDDASGRVIGFTGRILNDDANQAKYLNTSESPVFKKGEALYAISLARGEIKKQDLAVMVEGQMDVITSHQFGFINTVATSGTALTAEHLRIMKRYTSNVAFAFDGDAAGQKAARASVQICLAAEMNPLIVTIPLGKDPDECLRQNKEAWQKAIKTAVPAIDFLTDQEIEQAGLLNALKKKQIIEHLAPYLKLVANSVEQNEYIRRIASRLSISEDSIMDSLKSKKTYAQSVEAKSTKNEEAKTDPDMEQQAIGLILTYFATLPALPEIRFSNASLQDIYAKVREAKKGGAKNIDPIVKSLPKSWGLRVNTLIIETLHRHESLEEEDIQREIVDCLNRLREGEREARVSQNAQKIAAAFSAGDKDAARLLLKSLESDTIAKE